MRFHSGSPAHFIGHGIGLEIKEPPLLSASRKTSIVPWAEFTTDSVEKPPFKAGWERLSHDQGNASFALRTTVLAGPQVFGVAEPKPDARPKRLPSGQERAPGCLDGCLRQDYE